MILSSPVVFHLVQKKEKKTCLCWIVAVCSCDIQQVLNALPTSSDVSMDSEIFHFNFNYSPDRYYFLYIGELKGYGLNDYLQAVLSRQREKPVCCLTIVSDMLAQYDTTDIIAFSPQLAYQQQIHGSGISFRTPGRQFTATVSRHPVILGIVDQILAHQPELYISMFESLPEMTLDSIPGVSLLGPDKILAHKLNNKAFQFELLHDTIPVVDFRYCSSLEELYKVSDALRPQWHDGIFVSRPYSAAGAASAITFSREELESYFSHDDSAFLLTRYIPHTHDPTVLAVVANEEDVYIAGVADQCIEGGNRFVGSTWPSILPAQIITDLHRYTRRIGRVLGALGYRGIFGCDYIVDQANRVWFIEVNARKQGTTLEFCHTLEQILPAGSPSLLELEYFAVQKGYFPDHTLEPDPLATPAFCWGTYNFKIKDKVKTKIRLPQHCDEKKLFTNVVCGKKHCDSVVLEHVGAKQTVLPGTFLARTVSVGKDLPSVRTALKKHKEKIEETITGCHKRKTNENVA